jgi:dolichyl-phosphate-mannose-protein mannosyltransferase
MKPRHWLFAFLAALTVLRWIYAALIELSPDESYYFLWSQRLDWAYFSKGPGVALAIRLGTALFGANEFGVRFFSPLLALGTCLVLFYFTQKLYGESIAIWTVITLNAVPIFQAGSLLMTIDPLSIFFWAAALWTFWLALETSGRGFSALTAGHRDDAPAGSPANRRGAEALPTFNVWWPLTGLFIGLGFLSKYTNAMQLLSIALVLALTPKHRREFARPGVWTMLVVFGVCALPPLIWNQQHEWITMAHLKARGHIGGEAGIHPLEALKFLGAQLGVYSPLIFIGVMIALWWGWKKSRTSFKSWFLFWFAVPLLVMYFLLAFKKAGEPNWTAPAFVSLSVLAVAGWHRLIASSVHPASRRQPEPARRRLHVASASAAPGFAVLALGVGLAMSLGVLNTDIFRAIGIKWPYERDPGARLRGWKTAGELVARVRQDFERDSGQPVFLIANTYGTASEIAFYLPETPVKTRAEGLRHPPVYIPESQNIENQFSFWPRYDEFIVPRRKPGEPLPTTAEEESKRAGVNPFLGRTALFITDRDDNHPPSSIKNGFERTRLIGRYELQRRGLPLRSIRVFACYNYRSIEL